MVDDTEQEPIHPAVQLLLARMDSHPQEFIGDAKWGHRYQQYKSHWSPAEKLQFNKRLRAIRMDAMHEQLMKELTK